MINVTRGGNTVAQATPSFCLHGSFSSFAQHIEQDRGSAKGVTNVSRWVISSWLYNKQDGIKFPKWKQIRNRTPPTVDVMWWPWPDFGPALGILPEVAPRLLSLSLSVSPSVMEKSSGVMLKIKTSQSRYCQTIWRQAIERHSWSSWKFSLSTGLFVIDLLTDQSAIFLKHNWLWKTKITEKKRKKRWG